MKADWIIVQGESWTRFSTQGVERIEPFPRLRRTTRVLVDFRQGHTGVMRFEGPAKYARALIDREVRREGWVDGPTHIVMHDLLRQSEGGQAFFTAVALPDWQRLMTWARGQRAHCLVFSMASLLGRPKEGDGSVVHAGQRLMALYREGGELVFEDVFAASTDQDDLQAAAETLGRRLRGKAEGAESRASLVWRTVLSHAGATEGAGLAELLEATAGRTVSISRQVSVDSATGPVYSSLPRDGQRLGVDRTLNGWSSRVGWMAERAAPLVMVLMAVAAGLLGYAGQVAFERAESLDRGNQPLRAEVVEARERLASFEHRSVDDDLAALERFVTTLNEGDAFNPIRVLSDLKGAAGERIRVHRVYLESSRRGGHRLRVDGRFEGEGAARNFLTRLRDRGWQVEALDPAGEDEGSFSYRLSPREARA